MEGIPLRLSSQGSLLTDREKRSQKLIGKFKALEILRNESGIRLLQFDNAGVPRQMDPYGAPIITTIFYDHTDPKIILKKEELIQILLVLSDHDGYDESIFFSLMNGTRYARVAPIPENLAMIEENYQWLLKNFRMGIREDFSFINHL